MTDRERQTFLVALGARLLAEANDLKRTPETLATELGWEPTRVQAVLNGDADLETARELSKAIQWAYPVSFSDLWLDGDDTDHGVRVMTAETSQASSRVFDRADPNGGQTHYYEYRDTAMSRGAPFRPEWIQGLRVVDTSDPASPRVVFNNGHRLHQTTFFIGEVNFYYRLGGQVYGYEMNTGDSNYIAPFVPHSFTSRNTDRLGVIVAVTYAGLAKGALPGLWRLNADELEELAGDARDPWAASAAVVARHRLAESLSVDELVARLEARGITFDRANALAGGAVPDDAERAALAEDAACASVGPRGRPPGTQRGGGRRARRLGDLAVPRPRPPRVPHARARPATASAGTQKL